MGEDAVRAQPGAEAIARVGARSPSAVCNSVGRPVADGHDEVECIFPRFKRTSASAP